MLHLDGPMDCLCLDTALLVARVTRHEDFMSTERLCSIQAQGKISSGVPNYRGYSYTQVFPPSAVMRITLACLRIREPVSHPWRWDAKARDTGWVGGRDTYGLSRMYDELVDQGSLCGRGRIARLMRTNGLCRLSPPEPGTENHSVRRQSAGRC
jgi:hypothetical protein